MAVQVKSGALTEAKAQEEQTAALLRAAKDIRSASDSQLVAFLAIVGSNYAGMEDLEADNTLYCLQQEDLVALIPPFLRNSRVSLQGRKAWKVRMREWKKMEKESKEDPKNSNRCETFCLPHAMQLHFAWLSNFGIFRHR